MGYMSIQKHTDTYLCLLREPSFLSKAFFVAFFVGVLGIIVFGSESLFFKVLIGLGATCLSFLIVDNYEVCEFDKTTSEVKLTRLHWCQYLLGRFMCVCTMPSIKVKLEDIKDIRVEEQEGNTSGKAYHVVLHLNTGIQIGITEVFTTDGLSEHEAVANLIRSFLGDLPPSGDNSEADIEDEDISTSEDDFEQISRADLENLEEADETDCSAAINKEEAPKEGTTLVPEELKKADICEEVPT